MRTLRRSRPAAALAAAVALTGLAGCITLFPQAKPAELYRFGAAPAALAAAPAPGPPFAVRLAPLTFEAASAGDRILTIVEDRTAYIAGSRWISPADGLFAAAVTRAFETRGGPARLLAPGEPVLADFTHKLDVRTFEVRYPGAAGARSW